MNSSNEPPKLSQYLDKILFAIAGTYFIFVLVWLSSQNKLRLFPPTEQPLAKKAQLSPSDTQFIAYLQQSLTILERQAKNNPKPNPAPVAAVVKVPAAPLPPNPAPVVERVYVPVYPQNQPSGIAPFPTIIAPNRSNSLPQPPPLSPPPTAPISSVPVLTPGKVLLPSAVSPASSATPLPGYTLVGILESGTQSYVLFSLNDTTRRFEVGEVIGSSGWKLTAITNQRAVIARNGQKRFIEVGQTF